MADVHRAFKDVARATYAHGSRHFGDSEVVEKVSEILKEAAQEIEDVIKEASERRKEKDQGGDD